MDLFAYLAVWAGQPLTQVYSVDSSLPPSKAWLCSWAVFFISSLITLPDTVFRFPKDFAYTLLLVRKTVPSLGLNLLD